MKYTVYILKSEKDGSFYIGHTNNLDDRLLRHNEGRSLSTKAKRPWRIFYEEMFDSRAEAMKTEREFKSYKNRNYLERVIASR